MERSTALTQAPLNRTPPHTDRAPTRRLSFLLCVTVLLLLAACGRQTAVGEGALIAARSETPVVFPSQAIPETAAGDGVASVDYRPLVLWVPEFLAADPTDNAGNVLSAAVTQFEQSNPDVQVEIEIKAERGESSLFDYLRSAQKAAPGILPDVVALDTQQLWQVAELGLVQPISASTALQMVDFYDFALQSVTYNEQILGLPYAADTLHLIYHQDRQSTPPDRWEDLIASQATYLLPIADRDGASSDSLLTQYVGAGGELLESGAPGDPAAAEALLTFLQRARTEGTIPAQAVNYTDLETTWPTFVIGTVDLADASATSYLSQREILDGVGYADLPSRDGTSHTVARVWAFAILSEDPAQQALALELLQTFLSPSVHGPWSQFSHLLPTHRGSLAVWSSGHAYYDFLGAQLEDGAVAIPNGRLFAQFSQRLAEAAMAVLEGQLTPEEALTELRATP